MYSSRLVASLLISSLASAASIPEPALEERQIINGVNCVLAGVVVLVQNLVGDPGATSFCQSVLGYTTSTAYVTSTTTTNTTTTAYVPVGTATDFVTTLTAAAVLADPVGTTETASPTFITTCPQPVPAKRQAVSLSAGASAGGLSVSAVATPSGLIGASPSRISVVCNCLGPPTPAPVAATAIQVDTATFTQTVNVVATQSDTFYVTPTVIPTTTLTITPTNTVTSCSVAATADTSCGNQGMQWSVWADTNHVFLYEPAALAASAPVNSGSTVGPAVGLLTGSCDDGSYPLQLYDAYLSSCAWWALVHRGYIYAAQTGAYTFTIPAGIDDQLYVWVGNTAITGYSSANPLVEAGYGSPQVAYQYFAMAGEYIPLRVQFSQGPLSWAFIFQVTAPDGSIVIASDGSGIRENVVQFGCNGATTAWLPWGAEAS